jgi:hypothetical protein
MPKPKRSLPVTNLAPLAQQILGALRADFLEKNLSADDLREGYVGMSLPALVQQCCGNSTWQVDFDLTIKQLKDGHQVSTGPKVPYENRPGVITFIIALVSKREYTYLTEEGYRAAQQCSQIARPVSRPTVHISGGTFHQSPIGIGHRVTQSVSAARLDGSERTPRGEFVMACPARSVLESYGMDSLAQVCHWS